MKKKRLEGLWIEPTEIGFGGITQYTAWKKGYACPIGFVWCIRSGSETGVRRADIWSSYVLPVFRRQGVRMAIHEAMLKDSDFLFTGQPKENSKEGNCFLKKAGFKFIKEYGFSLLKSTPKGNKP